MTSLLLNKETPLKILTLAIILSFFCTTFVYAQRKKNQHHRIQQGVSSGDLTRKEAHKLHQEQKEIKEDRMQAMADGSISKEERSELKHERNKASRHIYKQKHDRQSQNNNAVDNAASTSTTPATK
ncbi:MAG: hypothetical protein ACOYL6_06025 [Bacteriovoracaceae bacterium]